MSSYVHFGFSAVNPQKTNLSDIILDLKKFMAGQIIWEIEAGPESRQKWLLNNFPFAAGKYSRNTMYQFWQQNNHAEELNSNHFQEQKLQYIHPNPVQEGWIEEAHHSLYSSARDYSGYSGLVPVTIVN